MILCAHIRTDVHLPQSLHGLDTLAGFNAEERGGGAERRRSREEEEEQRGKYMF